MNKLCTIGDCENKLAARGMCWKHYARWQKHGDPLLVTTPKNHICAECGDEFLRSATNQKYCSITCRNKKNLKGFGQANCIRCECEFDKTGAAQIRCVPCSNIVKKEQDKLRNSNRERHKKFCVECGSDISETPRRKRCVECTKEVRKESDRLRQAERRKLPESKEAARKRSTARNSTAEHREYIRKYERQRRKTDPVFAINTRMRAMVGNVLRGEKNGRSWREIVGYGPEELMAHIERQFTGNMGWDNRNLWHIDHIVPLSAFEFTTTECDGFKAAWAITNLRPLWSKENLKKSNKKLFLI